MLDQRKDPAQRQGAGSPSVRARRRSFLFINECRARLAAQSDGRGSLMRRYESLRLLTMITRFERECLRVANAPESRGSNGGDDPDPGPQEQEALAEWARPWGWACLLELDSSLSDDNETLRRLRRRLSRSALSEAEARAEERFRAIVSELAGRLEANPLAPAETTDGGASRPANAAKLSLNRATWEQLRGLSLSITQTKRLLAYREHRGGFRSIHELDKIVGFPKALRADLKQKLIA